MSHAQALVFVGGGGTCTKVVIFDARAGLTSGGVEGRRTGVGLASVDGRRDHDGTTEGNEDWRKDRGAKAQS